MLYAWRNERQALQVTIREAAEVNSMGISIIIATSSDESANDFIVGEKNRKLVGRNGHGWQSVRTLPHK